MITKSAGKLMDALKSRRREAVLASSVLPAAALAWKIYRFPARLRKHDNNINPQRPYIDEDTAYEQ